MEKSTFVNKIEVNKYLFRINDIGLKFAGINICDWNGVFKKSLSSIINDEIYILKNELKENLDLIIKDLKEGGGKRNGETKHKKANVKTILEYILKKGDDKVFDKIFIEILADKYIDIERKLIPSTGFFLKYLKNIKVHCGLEIESINFRNSEIRIFQKTDDLINVNNEIPNNVKNSGNNDCTIIRLILKLIL